MGLAISKTVLHDSELHNHSSFLKLHLQQGPRLGDLTMPEGSILLENRGVE